jgi:[NiFe] hydrogenase assembly HybE family chaperone
MADAVESLVADYVSIERRRMRGMPICNPELQVEAVGFQVTAGRLCGVLITPWFMNLVVLPAVGEAWGAADSGRKITCRFPAGEYEFTLSVSEDTGAHLSTPLFSTVQDFPDQKTARRVAEEALRRLFVGDNQASRSDPVEAELERSGLNRPISRRKLLRGWY